MSDDRVLLLGGSGFMGSRTARALLARGARVTVLSRGQRPVPEGAESLVADRDDPASLSAALEGRRFDFTVDFTAFDAPDLERLLLVPYAALGRYVMISTGQVYLVTEGATPPFREDDSERPVRPEPEPGTHDHANWAYGTGKRRAEALLRVLRASHGLRGTILRLPIVQGEGDGSLRLWAYLERLLDGGPLLLPDGGNRPLRHLYAGDVVDAILRLYDGPAPRERVYNLSPNADLTLRELIERVAALAGVTPRLVDVPWDTLHAAGLDKQCSPYASPWSSRLDPARVGAEFGLLGTRPEDYLPKVVRWHLEHRPAQSHPGYALRPLELDLAERLGARS